MNIPPFLLRLMRRDKLSMNFKIEPEQRECIQLADEMRARILEGKYKGIWLHIANEGKRHRIVAMIMKAMGMIPGAADFLFTYSDGKNIRVVWLEMKIKPNKQSDNQKDFEQWVRWAGFEYLLCYSKDESLAELTSRGAFA